MKEIINHTEYSLNRNQKGWRRPFSLRGSGFTRREGPFTFSVCRCSICSFDLNVLKRATEHCHRPRSGIVRPICLGVTRTLIGPLPRSAKSLCKQVSPGLSGNVSEKSIRALPDIDFVTSSTSTDCHS